VEPRWLTVGEVAQVLGISRERVRYYADARRLSGVIRTAGGQRLVPARAVAAMLADRQQRRARQQASER
jgi:excisionase family DNA binding protein